MYNRDKYAGHVQTIRSGPRRHGRKVKRYNTLSEINTGEYDCVFDANNEFNTRSDTICVGANWRLLSASGHCWDVYGFHDDFKGTLDVPVARVARGIHNENRSVHIMIVNQALYFGASLEHSPIKPNQIRHLGIPVSDNPYDSGP